MEALLDVIDRQLRPWTIVRVDLQQILESQDPLKHLTGTTIAEMYTRALGKGWTLGATQALKVLHAAIRARHARLVATLAAYWRHNPADMVVSVIPNFNRAIAESVRSAMPETPFVTILTDIADFPPHFWIERESEYLVCGSDRAVEQARALGQDDHHIFRTSGMVIHPRFYERPDTYRAEGRMQLGLDTDVPTGLVLFGGAGSSAMIEIAERLEHYRKPLQFIFICGHNAKVASRLRERETQHRCFVEGFTHSVPFYMRLSDFFIGKPGPGSVSEALACGLPVIVEANARTLPQERYNAEWIRKARLGISIRSFADITGAVSLLLSDCIYRQNATQIHNRAVFEVPDILEKIFVMRSAPADSYQGTAVPLRNAM